MTPSTTALQRIRQTTGLSRRQCAEAVGVDPHTWKRWELHIVQPTDEHKAAAAALLGVPVIAIDDWPARQATGTAA